MKNWWCTTDHFKSRCKLLYTLHRSRVHVWESFATHYHSLATTDNCISGEHLLGCQNRPNLRIWGSLCQWLADLKSTKIAQTSQYLLNCHRYWQSSCALRGKQNNIKQDHHNDLGISPDLTLTALHYSEQNNNKCQRQKILGPLV